MFEKVKSKIEHGVMVAACFATVGCMAYGIFATGKGLYNAAPTAYSYAKAIVTGNISFAASEDDPE